MESLGSRRFEVQLPWDLRLDSKYRERIESGTVENDEEKTSKKLRDVGEVINDLLREAKKIRDWDNPASLSTRELKTMIITDSLFGTRGDRFLHELIEDQNPKLPVERSISLWTHKSEEENGNNDQGFPGVGKQLLCWMIRDRDFYKLFTGTPSRAGGTQAKFLKKPIHLAIHLNNLSFLACFFGICYDPTLKQLRPKLDPILEAKEENLQDMNCIHYAIDQEIPFAPFLVAVCSAKALMDQDSKGYTPLNLALGRERIKKKKDIPDRPMSVSRDESADDGGVPGWDQTFDPTRILQEILRRKDVKGNQDDKLIETLLKTTNKEGNSPFQEGRAPIRGGNLSPQEIPNNRKYEAWFKSIIFDKVKDISDVSRALYGTKGDAKEFYLNMSDFNQSSHNFEVFINKLTQLECKTTASEGNTDGVLCFEDTLFFVHLPDLNYVKQPCPHRTIYQLFSWLADKGVRTIKKLSIPDNTTNPLSDATEERRRLARDAESDAERPTSNSWKGLKELTLYSSGNWSVLYQWISEDGLAKLPELRKVRIDIVHLDPAEGVHDRLTHDCHLALANEYKSRLEKKHAENKFQYKVEVKTDAKWNYPPPPHEPREPTTQVLQHQFTGQLLTSFNALRDWEKIQIDQDELEYPDGGFEDTDPPSVEEKERKRRISRFQTFALEPPRGSTAIDRIIRVAIIDNGADRIRSKFRHMIAKGQSFVTSDLLGPDRSLPWWMVSDPHGTQMASLIGQTNYYCRLYIARVGKGHNDVHPADAANAVDWAVEQKVDIISISWTLKQGDDGLRDALRKAAARQTLIFCLTADEGPISEAWPASYREFVVSVSATDRYGRPTAKAARADTIDIQIPSENMRAPGPSYIGNVLPTVSGSSVATALAAGIASLALLLLRTFNPELELKDAEGDRESIKRFYTREGIMRVFQKMGGPKTAIQLSKLFRQESTGEAKTLEILEQNWKVENFNGD